MFRLSVSKLNVHVPVVGADPCVRPTTVGRTESAKEVEAKDGNGKEEANAKSAEICRSDIGRTHGSAPTGGSCTQSTTGGNLEYNGIPYSAIVTEFLRQFNNGQTPV